MLISKVHDCYDDTDNLFQWTESEYSLNILIA